MWCPLVSSPRHPSTHVAPPSTFPPTHPPTRLITDWSCPGLLGFKTKIWKCQCLWQLTRNSPAPISGSTLSSGRCQHITMVRAVWKLFKLFVFVDLLQLRHMSKREGTPTITQRGKEEGKGGHNRNTGVNKIELAKQQNVQGHWNRYHIESHPERRG